MAPDVMFLGTVACSGLLAAIMAITAAQIATQQAQAAELLRRVGMQRFAPVVAVTSAIGAGGLVAGVVIAPIGVASASGILVQIGAGIAAHLRARDRNLAPAAVVGALAVLTLVLRTATA